MVIKKIKNAKLRNIKKLETEINKFKLKYWNYWGWNKNKFKTEICLKST